MFGFLRGRRRRKLLAEPFPPYWEAVLRRNVGHYPRLTPDQQARLRDLVRLFVAEKAFEGCGGLFVTDEIKVTVAGQAGLLLLGLDWECYARVPVVIVYPDDFQTPNPDDGWEDDHLGERIVEGQAHYRGPVILSWRHVLDEGRDPECGHNVVLHEFAHELDFLDQATDGTPPLESRDLEQRWSATMTAALDAHRKDLDAGRHSLFSEQAGDSPTEFFADATEAFFCRPHDLDGEEPEVFGLLKGYYRVDPRAWFPAS